MAQILPKITKIARPDIANLRDSGIVPRVKKVKVHQWKEATMTVLLGWQKTKAFYIQRSSIDHPPKADKLVYVDGGLYIATQKEILHSLVQNERRKPLVRDCCVIIRDDHELLEVIGPSTHTGRICYRLKPQMPTASQVT